jgi:hypothetical protein
MPMTASEIPLTISVNGCTLFDGVLPGGEWDRSFSLSGCPATLMESPKVRIRITSGHSQPRLGQRRALGVPIVALEFVTS